MFNDSDIVREIWTMSGRRRLKIDLLITERKRASRNRKRNQNTLLVGLLYAVYLSV